MIQNEENLAKVNNDMYFEEKSYEESVSSDNEESNISITMNATKMI